MTSYRYSGTFTALAYWKQTLLKLLGRGGSEVFPTPGGLYAMFLTLSDEDIARVAEAFDARGHKAQGIHVALVSQRPEPSPDAREPVV
jgi:hypothetical protein